jgi:hypothetical protein
MDREPAIEPPPIPWLGWIARGLALDALLWLPACRWDLDGWWPRAWLVSLLCWSHLFILPALFLDPDRSPERLAAVALRGVWATALADVLAVVTGFVAFWVLVAAGLGLMAQGSLPEQADPRLAGALYVTPFAAAGIVGALSAMKHAMRTQHWRIRFHRGLIALGGAIAACVFCFPFAPHPDNRIAHDYLVLAALALPALLLTRPRVAIPAAPKWPVTP